MTDDEQPSRTDVPAVVAVVVAYDRRALVLEVLAAVLAQDPRPAEILLIDNASSDGTAQAVRSRFPSVRLMELTRNTGGAGGFAVGIGEATAGKADLAWLLDDDAVPEPGALAALLDAHARYPGRTPPAAVASRVVWVDGRLHRMNVPRRRRDATRRDRRAAAAVGCTPMRSASFCSLLVDLRAARREPLPVADYFLWNDDFEYTARLLRARPGLLCPASVVVHKTATFYSSGSAPGDRFYYDVRNMIWMLTRSRALAPSERLLFAAVTARRWARTLYRAPSRTALCSIMLRGIVHGLRRGPSPTRTVLADVWPSPRP